MAKKFTLPYVRNAKAPVRVVHAAAKPAQRVNRIKLLVSIVNRGDDERISEILNDFSVSLAFSTMGMGTARSAVLNYLGIGTSEKAVMFSLIPESDEEEILNSISSKMALYLVGRGISFTIPLSAVSELVANGLTGAAANKTVDGRKIMKDNERKYDLIIAEVAAGYVDDAMEAARSQGAAGGTILRARSINNAKAEQFIGISINKEAELLLILAERASRENIMNALSQSSGLKTEAGGILYSLPVDRVAGTGTMSPISTDKTDNKDNKDNKEDKEIKEAKEDTKMSS